MPDNEPHQNAPHLDVRRGVTGGPVTPQPSLHEDVAAGVLARHIAAGDMGAFRQAVNGLEHRLEGWTVDPWRVLTALGTRLGHPAPAPAPAPTPELGADSA